MVCFQFAKEEAGRQTYLHSMNVVKETTLLSLIIKKLAAEIKSFVKAGESETQSRESTSAAPVV